MIIANLRITFRLKPKDVETLRGFRPTASAQKESIYEIRSKSRFVRRLFSVLVILLSSTAPLSWGQGGDFAENELVCQPIDSAYISTINSTYSTSIKSYLPLLSTFLLETSPGVNAESLSLEISLDTNVIYCEANYVLDAPEPVQGSQPFIDFVGNEVVSSQPAALGLGLPSIHETVTGVGAKVGVIDVGINTAHPFLSNVSGTGYDYIDGDTTAFDETGGSASGHGTFVAGIISMVAPDAEIVPYRVLDTAGRGNGYTIAEAILQSVLDGCNVINMSMVMYGSHSTIDSAVDFALSNEVIIVCASGNDASNIERFPGSNTYTLSVTAVDSVNTKADFANFGGMIDVCAPGTQIYSPYLDTSYAWWDGTSFAAPFVTGQIALMIERNPLALAADIYNSVRENAVNIDSLNPLYVGELGFGLIDIGASLNQIQILCGDIDGDGNSAEIPDLTYLIDYIFRYGPPPIVAYASDMDGSGVGPDIADLTYLIDYVFREGPPLACPSL